MNVIMFYEHMNRDKQGNDIIISKLKAFEDVSIANFSIVFEYYDAITYAKKNGVDVVIVPWLYSKKDYELVVPFIRANPNVYVINLHHEQIFSDLTKNILISNEELCKNNVIHFVWGEKFRDELIKSGVKKELIFITGNIRTDTVFLLNDKNTLKKNYSQKYNLDINKSWILYSESRDWVWGNKENMQKVFQLFGCESSEFQLFYEETVKSINTTIKDIKKLDDEFFQQFELIYRQHPGTLTQQSFDSRVKFISEHSIYNWLEVVDVNIVSGSTTIFESDMIGIASFVDNSFEINSKYQTVGLDEYPSLGNINEINNDLIIKVKENLNAKKIYLKYIGIVDGKVGERIAQKIYSISSEGLAIYKNDLIKINKCRYILKYMREKYIKVVVKLNLLKILKRPKIAFRMINDIPYMKK